MKFEPTTLFVLCEFDAFSHRMGYAKAHVVSCRSWPTITVGRNNESKFTMTHDFLKLITDSRIVNVVLRLCAARSGHHSASGGSTAAWATN